MPMFPFFTVSSISSRWDGETPCSSGVEHDQVSAGHGASRSVKPLGVIVDFFCAILPSNGGLREGRLRAASVARASPAVIVVKDPSPSAGAQNGDIVVLRIFLEMRIDQGILVAACREGKVSFKLFPMLPERIVHGRIERDRVFCA